MTEEPEFDPESASQLAELLNLGLADNDDTADGIAQLLDEAGESLGPFDDDDDEPDELALEEQADAGVGPDDDVPMPAPDEPEDDADALRSGAWTDPERRRARGRHAIYRLHATHHRTQPIVSQFTGECQSVRVRLPERRPASGMYIGTYIGRVESGDHLLFSVDEVREIYEQQHGRRPTVERVDLITGARFLGRRFSPVSCFLAYSQADAPEPCFYILEGGSASGQPKALYVAPDLGTPIHQRAGFRFTPLTCTDNWYTGALTLDAEGHPSLVHLTSAQAADGAHQYLELHVRYAIEQRPRRVISPFGLQIEAAMRVLAIAEQAGCELGKGRGGRLQGSLGPIVENSRRWDIHPQGSANAAQRDRFCGCPKSEE